MNLSFIDWLIAAVCILVLYLGVRLSKKLVRSVADFLSAGRSAGRYMITVSQGMAAIGAFYPRRESPAIEIENDLVVSGQLFLDKHPFFSPRRPSWGPAQNARGISPERTFQ